MKFILRTLKHLCLICFVIVFIFPVIYMVACSFMPPHQVSNALDFSDSTYKSIDIIPETFTAIQHYLVYFRNPQYLYEFFNSLIITVPTVIGQTVVASLAAFAFAKLRFPLRDKLFFLYIILLILPLQVTIVPNYIILDNMGLLNNFLSIILPGTFSAFGICLLRQSIKYISSASIEAARIDGAGYFKIFTRIILPQIKGGLITLILLTFIDNYNTVEQPLIYFEDKGMYPLSLTLTQINKADFGIVFACGVMFMIPPMLIFLYGHKDIDSPFAGADK